MRSEKKKGKKINKKKEKETKNHTKMRTQCGGMRRSRFAIPAITGVPEVLPSASGTSE